MSRPESNEFPLARYLPLLAWMIVVLTLLFIPLYILGNYGYVAGGDARRHVAKAFTAKPYTEILRLRPEYSMDHSPGWEWLLRFVHQKTGWQQDALMSFSVAGLMLCVFFAPLPWLRRPEAWLAALLAQMVAIPELMIRFTQARPLLLTEGILIAVLFAWATPDKKPSAQKLTLTTLGIAFSVWMHGAWYLWALPVAAFFLARAWRTAFALTACFAAGIIAGAVFTGKPVEFLRQALEIVALISREHLPQWMLVGELRPSYGEFDTLALIAIIMIFRWLQIGGREAGTRAKRPDYLREPVFCLIVVCWILGFKADRFWADWGVPAVLVWLVMQFEELLPALWSAADPKRIIACLLLATPLFLDATNDLDRRYTFNRGEYFLDASDPALQGWLPEGNGIFYSAQMGFFYNTFYKNPTAEWRYILGLEPALMPQEDLEILRYIQRSNFAAQAYEPWVNKLRPVDRLEVEAFSQPNIPQLEWRNALGNIWIGRLPKAAKP